MVMRMLACAKASEAAVNTAMPISTPRSDTRAPEPSRIVMP